MAGTSKIPKIKKYSLNGCFWQTRKGWVAVAVSSKGLVTLILPMSDYHSAWEHLLAKTKKPVSLHHFLCPQTANQVRTYFEGEKVVFNSPLDTRSWTNFQKEVYEVVRSIPYGEVRNYGWVAKRIGKPGGSRAVGQALKNNPLPLLVPCHRVVAADGSLGGFAYGISAKRCLLELERASKGMKGK